MSTADESSNIPAVSGDDLAAFFHHHFSDKAVAQFDTGFLHPGEAPQDESYGPDATWDEEDDGLGYYEDGVKRTLTDEQIEIFRHSEIRELERKQRREEQSNKGASKITHSPDSGRNAAVHGPSSSSITANKKKTKKKGGKRHQTEPKPDLRKRTWDVVDQGLDTLNYD